MHINETLAVPFTDDSAKPALLDDVADIEKKQALWTLISVVVGAAAGLALAPATALIAGPAALCVYALQLEKIDTNRILNDPPRPDYAVPVRARRRRFDSRHMQSPIESATAAFVERVLELSAYLEAAVRADERGQQALALGDYARVRERLLEGRRATDRAASTATALARAADELAHAWSTSTAIDRALSNPRLRAEVTRGVRGQVDAGGLFQPEALAYVAQSKFVTDRLRPVVHITEADAEAVVSNPQNAIRERAASFASVTVRAISGLRDGYGEKSRYESRDWDPRIDE